MSKTLGKLNDFVTIAVASVAQAARNLSVLQFADLVKKKDENNLISPTALVTTGAKIRARGRVSTVDEDADFLGLGGDIEEDEVEVEIEIEIGAQRLDAETIDIISNTSLEDAEKIVIKHKLTKFHEIDESTWIDPDT